MTSLEGWRGQAGIQPICRLTCENTLYWIASVTVVLRCLADTGGQDEMKCFLSPELSGLLT